MDKTYTSVIEALIFSSDEPISELEIIKAIKGIDGEDIEISQSEVGTAIEELNNRYEANGSSFNIKKIANGYIFATTEISAKYVGYLSSEKTKRRLSQAALETLAIIAYKQPVTKPELEQITRCQLRLYT